MLSDSTYIKVVPRESGNNEDAHNMRVCKRCNQKKPIEVFEGFVQCNICRSRKNDAWHRTMDENKKAGVGQRVVLTDQEEMKLNHAFDQACAFCGNADADKLRRGRLVHPRDGGGDDLFNVILCCTSCQQSRKGGLPWDVWYRRRRDIFLQSRYDRVLAWHNQVPVAKVIGIHRRL